MCIIYLRIVDWKFHIAWLSVVVCNIFWYFYSISFLLTVGNIPPNWFPKSLIGCIPQHKSHSCPSLQWGGLTGKFLTSQYRGAGVSRQIGAGWVRCSVAWFGSALKTSEEGKSCSQLLGQEGVWFMTPANQKRTRAEDLGFSQLGCREARRKERRGRKKWSRVGHGRGDTNECGARIKCLFRSVAPEAALALQD